MQTTHALSAYQATGVRLATLGAATLAATMLLCGGLFVAFRMVAPSDGTVGAYVTTSWQADSLVVETLPGYAGPLRPGDLVAAVAGRPLADWLAGTLDPALNRPSHGAGATLSYAVTRDGVAQGADVALRPFPLLEVLLGNWSTVVWAAAMALVAVYLFVRRPREAATRALLLLGTGVLASSVPWLLGIGPAEIVAGGALPILYLVTTFAVYAIFWSAGLHFSLVFPRPLAAEPLQGRLVMLAYLVPLSAQAAWMIGSLPGSQNLLGWIGGWTVAQLVIVPAVILATLGILTAQWRAAGVERAKLRWIMAAAALAIVGVLAGWFLPQALTGAALLPWSAIGLPGLAFPVALGIAVGRHGFFGIETLIHRSLVYGGLTAGVILAYAATVVVLGTILPGEGPYAVTLLATGVAGLVALPMRDRLQRAVSHLLYGDRDEPHRAIARLGQRLEASLDPRAILPMVAETVADALKLPYVAIELRRNGGAVVAAAHGAPRDDLERLPLVHRGEEIGWLVLARRAPGEAFSAADRGLLAELGRQAGAAAYAVRLTGELQRSREQLVTTREEERRRLRRDLHDGVGPALAGSLMKLEAARGLAGSDPVAVDRLLSELASETRQAIDEIRRMAYHLRPPALDQLGLVAALEQDAQRLAANGSVFRVSATTPLHALPAAVEVAAYRIGLEALTNVAHHAQASHAWLDLDLAHDMLVVDARDDGNGDGGKARAGVGLTSMRERAEELGGELEIGRAAEGGLRVTARLPMPRTIGHA